MNQTKVLALDQVLQRTVLVRLFLPLVAVSVMALVGAGYLGEQTLENRQRQMAQSLARIVDRYLDQAARTLEAVARVAEMTPTENLTFMQGTWEAYGYFDTLYYLDAGHKIKQLVPPDPRYLGLDMSNLPRLVPAGDQHDPSLSRPFISLRTGNPTVYLVKPLSQGGQMVGELSLGALQEEITQSSGVSSQDTIFIMDQTGMLLAHPAFDLVKQQTNQSDLEVFRRGLSGAATLVYEYAGTTVLGSAVRIDRAGWVVVDQVPLSASLGLYVWALGLILLTACLIWLAVAWSLRRQLERHVADPLRQLSRGTGALANGDFSHGRALASLPATFAELTTLATDFQHMSDALLARQAELQASEARFRAFVERANDIIYLLSPEGVFTYVSHNWQELLGHEIGEVTGQSYELFVHPDDRAACRAVLNRVITTGERVTAFEYRVLHKNGRWHWHASNAAAIYDAGSQSASFLGIARDITERRQTEEALQQAHTQLERSLMFNKALLSAIPTPVFYKDRAGRYLGCNRAFAEFTGVGSDQLEGKTVMELWPSENAAVYHERDLALMRQPERQVYEFRVRDKAGIDHPVIFAKDVFYDETQQVAGIVGAFLDITERQRAEAALRSSEQRYRLVFENSPVSLWEEDFSQVKTYFDDLRASGVTNFRAYFETHPEAVAHCAHLIKVLDVNQATLALLGAEDKQGLLAGLPQVLADSELKVLREEMIAMAAGEQDFESSEEIHRTAAGDYRLVTVRTSVAPGYEQSLGKVLVSLVDMTDHKRTEQALRESEARLRTLIDNLPIEFWAMDDTLRFTMQNALSLENLEPVVGQRLQDINLPDDLKALWIEEDLRVLEGHTLRKEYETDLAGQRKTYENIMAPVRVGESIVGLVGVAIDVTARKQAEEKIRLLNQELEQRVADRTAQLAAANKELEAFAYSVSHDLRAPLRHIAGFVELLQARTAATLDDQSQHYLANIAASASRMGALIDDLLSFSRMGRHEFARQRVDVDLLAREVIQVMEPEVRGRRINWQLADLPVVTGDAAMLRVVLVNLIDNALKFTRPRAEAEIEIGCKRGAPGEAIVFVRDNGVGFDMTYVDRLFGVFQRLHHPDEFEGTGIGLANVRRIITRHGGRTWAEGAVNQGATFFFSLPQSVQGA